jgi:hypothetical protein
MASAECSEETELLKTAVLEAVKKNSVSLFESVRNTYSEIQLLTSLAECNEEGETPLAIAIKSNCVSVVEEMLRFLKNVPVVYCVEHQLKITFIIHQVLHQFPIKELIDILIHEKLLRHRTCHVNWLIFIAKIGTKSISITRQDKIILLELIGSHLIQLCYGTTEDVLCIGNRGFECWREAMTLRYFPTDGGDLIPKLSNFHVPSESSSFIFGSAVEVATIEELDLLQEDFQRTIYWDDKYLHIQFRQCSKRMVIQALFVIRRISAPEQIGHPQHWSYLQSLSDFAGNFRDFGDNFVIKTCLFILEEFNGYDPNLLPRRSFDVLKKTLDELSRVLYSSSFDLLENPPNSPDSPEGRELNYPNLLIITKLVTTIQANHPNFQILKDGHPDFTPQLRFLDVIYRLVFILDSISSRITSEEQKKLKKFYCDYLKGYPERTTTVLHRELSRYNWMFKDHVEQLETIQRILKFGADPNASDEFGRTPLHHLAERAQYNEDKFVPLFQVFLDAGAHLDVTADDGKTVICILKETFWYRLGKLSGKFHPYFGSLLNSVLPLSCSCARVIRRHGVPLDRLPPRLKKLVSIHSAKGKQIVDHNSAFLEK